MQEQNFGLGCNIEPRDNRDFDAGLLYGGAELPDEFVIDIPFHTNQGKIDSCVGHAIAAAKGKQDQIQESPRFVWGLAKKEQWYEGWGTSKKIAMKQVIEYGITPYGMIDESHTLSRDEYMKFDLTENLIVSAKPNKAQSYWTTWDIETVKQTLYETKEPMVTSMMWFKSFNNPVGGFLPKPIGSSSGHMFVFKGWKKDKEGREYFVYHNSWGDQWGDNGDFYIYTDELYMYNLDGYSIIVDIPKDKAILLNKYNKKLVKNQDKPEVYYISNGKIAHIKDEETFVFGRDAGFWGNWSDIIIIEDLLNKDITI